MEVITKLRFTTPCLGDQRSHHRDTMRRDSDGNVVMLQAWWRSSLRYAAQAIGLFHKEVDQVQADPVITGKTKLYKRYYSLTEFKEHEAFLDGDFIDVKFMLPNNLSLENFRELLTTAGRFAGISPYGFKQNFGRFVVVELVEVKRVYGRSAGSGNAQVRELAQDHTSKCEPVGGALDVHKACTERR